LIDAKSLGIEAMCPGKALVVYLPNIFEPHVQTLAGLTPQVLVHPDLSLERFVAYLSWSAPAETAKLPLTAWVKLADMADALDLQKGTGDSSQLQVVMVAGNNVGISSLLPDDTFKAGCVSALAQCEALPAGFSEQELAKAKVKAAAYSDRPWMFMSYELRNGATRLAVSWAPLRRMHPGTSTT
jgi:hypothetical protein